MGKLTEITAQEKNYSEIAFHLLHIHVLHKCLKAILTCEGASGSSDLADVPIHLRVVLYLTYEHMTKR